ncbi:AaceriAER310Wp [[Ashbya] aceris (nom. inval.)]|nr:AaceriAER310Wp [[Ashbya] aceris (nom. inval.)]
MSYLPTSADPDKDLDEMTFSEKMVFHCKREPLVPTGVLMTTGAILLAIKNVRSGNRRNAQKWFRWRVGFQTATLVALIAGSFIYGSSKREQLSKEEQLRQKAKMREQLWIEELERRDLEVRRRKQRAEEARRKAAEMQSELSGLENELRELEASRRK